MPYLNVKLCAPPSPETTQRIASFLTDLTASILHKKQEVTAVAVEYLPAQQWFIGGTSQAARGAATFYLDIKVTEGTNTKNEKAEYIKRVFAGFEAALGRIDPASYIVIHEVRADAWGYAGETQEYRYIRGKPL